MMPGPGQFKQLAWMLCLLLVAGCGFQPRGDSSGQLSSLSPVYIKGRAEYDPFVRELRKQLREAGVLLTQNKSEAASVLQIHQLKRKSSVFSVNSYNRALEYEVRYDLDFSFEQPPGRMRLKRQQLDNRSIVYMPGGALLGRIRESELQKADAYRDLAQRLIQRLQYAD